MQSTVVIGLKASLLAYKLANRYNLQLASFTNAQFADTEVFISIFSEQSLIKKKILLVYQFEFETKKSINDQLVSLFSCINLIKNMGTRSIKLFLPYLPYARQDMSQDKQFTGSVFMLGACLKTLGVSLISTCQIHEPSISRVFPLPIQNITLEYFWEQILRQQLLKSADKNNFCIASPDEGGRQRAEALGALLNLPVLFIRKKRIAPDTAIALEVVGEIKYKKVILIDDIIDTGRTAISSCQLLLEHGAQSVYGCFVHAIFSGDARKQIEDSRFEKIFVTDTTKNIDNKDSKKIVTVDVSNYLIDSFQWKNYKKIIL